MINYMLLELEYCGDKAIAVDWSRIPKEIIEKLPSDYFVNVNAIDPSGRLVERTVVYMTAVEFFETDCIYRGKDGINFGWDRLDEEI